MSPTTGQFPKAKPKSSARSQPRLVSARKISTGDIDRSNVAIGDGAMVIVHQALNAADEARALEDYEQEKLARAVAEHARSLYEQVSATPAREGSPYNYLLPYELADASRFFGREASIGTLLENLTGSDSRSRLAVLHGDAGMGKTSVLKAGIVPALVSAQHLPLVVRVSGEALATGIKQSLLPNLNTVPILRDAPLQEFVRQVAALLPKGKHLFLLLDQFEAFFEMAIEARQQFVDELSRCLFDSQPRDHWLICIRSAFVGHLHSFDPLIPPGLLNNSITLPPLNMTEARLAILEPARLRGIDFEDSLPDAILADLGGNTIDPSQLQLVLHTLAEGLPAGERTLTLAAYERAGRAKGIARDHLSLVLARNLLPADRQTAWRLLAALAEKGQGSGFSQIADYMAAYGVNQANTRRVLRSLENNHLARQSEEAVSLTSESLLAPIGAWARQQATIEQVRAEAKRQLERVRGSALRGLLGGALGLCLAYLAAYWSQTVDRSLLPINTAFEAMPGAIAGLLFILAIDISQASYQGSRRWMRWAAGAAGGAIAFGQALLFHTALNVVFDPAGLLLATLQGALWGAVAGIGAVWIMNATRPLWQSLPTVGIACGLVFWLADSFGHAFQRPRLQAGDQNLAGFLVLAGAIMPLLVIVAGLLGRRSEIKVN